MKVSAAFFGLLTLLVGVGSVFAGPTARVWLDVPFIAQTKDGCGSASISMVMRYWADKSGQNAPPSADPQKIQDALFVPSQGGIPASQMQKYFAVSGYRAFAFQGEWQDLKHHLELGRPLIVGLRASAPYGPLHYVVVVGIDAEHKFLFLNDAAQQKMLRISREGFESEWLSTHNWTLLAVPEPAN